MATYIIYRENVVAVVQRIAAYEGVHSQDFNNHRIKDDDITMLDRYENEAHCSLMNLLKEFLDSGSISSTKFTYELSLPSNGKIASDDFEGYFLTAYIVNYVAGKWLEMLGVKKCENYLAQSAELLQVINSMVYQRFNPIGISSYNTTVDIVMASVREEVLKTTEYEGAHAGIFEDTRVKDSSDSSDDAALLEVYQTEAYAKLADLFKDYTYSSEIDSIKTRFNMQIPASCSATQTELLNDATQFCSNYMTGKWLLMVGVDKYKKYLAKANDLLSIIRNNIYQRKRPTRPS